jgi:hypothetical protein
VELPFDARCGSRDSGHCQNACLKLVLPDCPDCSGDPGDSTPPGQSPHFEALRARRNDTDYWLEVPKGRRMSLGFTFQSEQAVDRGKLSADAAQLLITVRTPSPYPFTLHSR